MEGVTPFSSGNFCVSQWSHGVPLMLSFILSKGFWRLKRAAVVEAVCASLPAFFFCAMAGAGTRRRAMAAITSRVLRGDFMIICV